MHAKSDLNQTFGESLYMHSAYPTQESDAIFLVLTRIGSHHGFSILWLRWEIPESPVKRQTGVAIIKINHAFALVLILAVPMVVEIRTSRKLPFPRRL